jgi:ubiquitin C-terminal hydrolase
MQITGSVENSVDNLATICYTMMKNMYKKEYSEMLNIFYGIHVSEITSQDTGETMSLTPEPFSVLSIPIPRGTGASASIFDCLDLYCHKESLEGDNAWFNEKTGQKEDIKKQISFWNFPKIMVIVLKRFTPDGQYKINQHIEFPVENLDLSRFVRGYNPSSFVYDLFGICNHMGGPMGGHYTAFVKNAQNNWNHYNDRSVETINDPKTVITPLAYCLFYRKKNNLV